MCHVHRRDSMSVMGTVVLDAVDWNVLYVQDRCYNTFVCFHIVQCNNLASLVPVYTCRPPLKM